MSDVADGTPLPEVEKTGGQTTAQPWWRKTVVYQIYPRSFKDSTGDGIGDLPGIISKLDYLQDLGVETIWFSPFYKSPQADFGYDIAGYREIAPEYGTLEDAERLITEIHARDMKVVFDMVLNHTSDQHPWFQASRSSRDDPKRDWYVWRDGRKPGGQKPPNNWRSMIGGSGWHYDETTDQWYWAQFLPCQPDLNYRNPAVKQEMLDNMRFWLKKGVDGFRLDIINAVYEDEEFRDNPFSFRILPSDENPAALFQNPLYTRDHDDTLAFMHELRAVVDEFTEPSRFLVGEVSAPLPILKRYLGEQNDGLNLVFLFQSLGVRLKARPVRELVQRFEARFPDPFLPTWVFSNHDRMRRISRLGDNVAKAKLNATFQLTARGVPFVYYGEEIGMPQNYLPVKTALDPVALKYKWIPQFLFKAARKVIGESLNRDECRTPMQWTAEPNAGFCSGNARPWLPLTPKHEEVNVEVQRDDPHSLFNCYKRLLRVRRETPALHSGSLGILGLARASKDILAYARTVGSGESDKSGKSTARQTVHVYLNFTKGVLPVQPADRPVELLFATDPNHQPIKDGGAFLALEPYEGVVVVPEHQ